MSTDVCQHEMATEAELERLRNSLESEIQRLEGRSSNTIELLEQKVDRVERQMEGKVSKFDMQMFALIAFAIALNIVVWTGIWAKFLISH